MGLEDAFRLRLPPPMSRLTIGGLLDEVFSEEDAAQLRFLSALDIQANPDLPAMYEELLDIFAQWRRDDCTLRFLARNGPQVALADRVEDHLNHGHSQRGEHVVDATLDLAIEQAHDVLGRFADWGGGNGALMRWLQQRTFLYFHGQAPVSPVGRPERQAGPGPIGHRQRGLRRKVSSRGPKGLGFTSPQTRARSLSSGW